MARTRLRALNESESLDFVDDVEPVDSADYRQRASSARSQPRGLQRVLRPTPAPADHIRHRLREVAGRPKERVQASRAWKYRPAPYRRLAGLRPCGTAHARPSAPGRAPGDGAVQGAGRGRSLVLSVIAGRETVSWGCFPARLRADTLAMSCGSCTGLGGRGCWASIRRPALPRRDLTPGSPWSCFGSLICRAISRCFWRTFQNIP
jgi:hypothetical protein